VRQTLRALLVPQRLLPIVIVCGSLIAEQWLFRGSDPFAVPLAVVMCAGCVLLAPVSWRVLRPDEARGAQAVVRLALYVAIALGVVLSAGLALPRLLGMGRTFLTQRSSLMVCAALFLVGGWGLGRDVDLTDSLRKAQSRAQALVREAQTAQLLALRAHLDPHFLFNTLNAIAEWCREDGEVAERAVLQLSAILRAVLAGVQERAWPLQRELDLAGQLLALHRLRDPARFAVSVQVASDLPEIPVPPMILLPLIENAVKHGPAAGHAGQLTLDVRLVDATVRIEVTNPGAFRGPRAGGEGLSLLQRRLQLSYGAGAALRVHADGEMTVAELFLPSSGPEALA
jgi:signal transduction histidine kinase